MLFRPCGDCCEKFPSQEGKAYCNFDNDFHHCNAAQNIFYYREDVLFVSLHRHPEDAYPISPGILIRPAGEGFTLNYAMRPGTADTQWVKALLNGIAKIRNYGADALVISLRVDAFKDDPISFIKLTSDDFLDCDKHIAELKLSTVFCMEGGYAIEAVGINTVNVLEGFENG